MYKLNLLDLIVLTAWKTVIWVLIRNVSWYFINNSDIFKPLTTNREIKEV
ncbi:hypothetical protein [Candidatus Hodgkinia cicadicola]